MRKTAALLLCLFICCGLPSLKASAENPAFTLEISVREPVYVNGTAAVLIRLANVSVPLSGVEFALQFDDALAPVITENANDEMNVFIKASPQDRWEQACRYDGGAAGYILRFSAPDGAVDESTLVKTADDLLIEIPFTAAAEGETALSIPDGSIIGVDKDLNLLSGTGAEKRFPVIVSDKIQLKASSGLKRYAVGESAFIAGIREQTPVSELPEHFINTGLKLFDSAGNPYAEKFCGTGMKICLFGGETLLDGVTTVVKGDLDGDGAVTAVDCLYVKRYCLNNLQLNGAQLQAGYLGEEEISAFTYLLLKRHILGNYNIYDI